MKTLPNFWPTLAGAVIVCGVFSGSASAQFEEMAKYIPGQANVLVMVNVNKVFNSEIAKSQDWQSQRGKRFESGLTAIPPAATYVTVGSQVDLEIMRTAWDAAVVTFDKAPNLADIAQHFGGVEDSIAGTPALRVADDSYVVQLSDTMLGAFGPGNRQMVSSWIQQKHESLSPYLQEALRFEEEGAAVIMAIDTTDIMTPGLVEARLAASENEALKKTKLDTKQIAGLVSSLRGIMLGINFGKQPYASLKIDFGQDVSALADIAEPMLLTALENQGAMLDEMANWKVEVKGKQIFFKGYLQESGLTRIASLINLPTNALHAKAGAAQSAATNGAADTQSPSDPAKVVLETTQAYYKSIERILGDLKDKKGEAKAISQWGMWFNNYANKVDRLPILNVDDEMLQYGQYMAQQLRNCSMSIKNIGIQKNVAQMNSDNSAAPFNGVLGQSANSYYANGGYGRCLGAPAMYGWVQHGGIGNAAYWAGRSEMNEAMQNRAVISSQARAAVGTSVQAILEQMREAQTKVRTDMTKKYQVEF
jgi:hypothetical protein